MSYDNPLEHAGWRIDRVGQGILVQDGKVLLTGNRWFSAQPLVWTLPGGRSDEGEGILDTLVREFREETALTVEPGTLAYVVEARSAIRRQIYLTCAFVVSRVSGELSHHADESVEALEFVPITELPSYVTIPSIAEPLRWYFDHPGEQTRFWFYPEYESG